MYRMSHDRICCSLVHTSIVINNENLRATPLIPKNQGIFTSNVRPSIPCEVIEKSLKQHKIQIASRVRFEEADLEPGVGFDHVVCSRRDVHISAEPIHTLATNLTIRHGGLNYHLHQSSYHKVLRT